MATWWSSSSAGDRPLAGPAARAVMTRAVPVEFAVGARPGRWSHACLVLVLVMVPGSINLAIMALPFLLGIGRLRRYRVPCRKPAP